MALAGADAHITIARGPDFVREQSAMLKSAETMQANNTAQAAATAEHQATVVNQAEEAQKSQLQLKDESSARDSYTPSKNRREQGAEDETAPSILDAQAGSSSSIIDIKW